MTAVKRPPRRTRRDVATTSSVTPKTVPSPSTGSFFKSASPRTREPAPVSGVSWTLLRATETWLSERLSSHMTVSAADLFMEFDLDFEQADLIMNRFESRMNESVPTETRALAESATSAPTNPLKRLTVAVEEEIWDDEAHLDKWSPRMKKSLLEKKPPTPESHAFAVLVTKIRKRDAQIKKRRHSRSQSHSESSSPRKKKKSKPKSPDKSKLGVVGTMSAPKAGSFSVSAVSRRRRLRRLQRRDSLTDDSDSDITDLSIGRRPPALLFSVDSDNEDGDSIGKRQQSSSSGSRPERECEVHSESDVVRPPRVDRPMHRMLSLESPENSDSDLCVTTISGTKIAAVSSRTHHSMSRKRLKRRRERQKRKRAAAARRLKDSSKEDSTSDKESESLLVPQMGASEIERRGSIQDLKRRHKSRTTSDSPSAATVPKRVAGSLFSPLTTDVDFADAQSLALMPDLALSPGGVGSGLGAVSRRFPMEAGVVSVMVDGGGADGIVQRGVDEDGLDEDEGLGDLLQTMPGASTFLRSRLSGDSSESLEFGFPHRYSPLQRDAALQLLDDVSPLPLEFGLSPQLSDKSEQSIDGIGAAASGGMESVSVTVSEEASDSVAAASSSPEVGSERMTPLEAMSAKAALEASPPSKKRRSSFFGDAIPVMTPLSVAGSAALQNFPDSSGLKHTVSKDETVGSPQLGSETRSRPVSTVTFPETDDEMAEPKRLPIAEMTFNSWFELERYKYIVALAESAERLLAIAEMAFPSALADMIVMGGVILVPGCYTFTGLLFPSESLVRTSEDLFAEYAHVEKGYLEVSHKVMNGIPFDRKKPKLRFPVPHRASVDGRRVEITIEDRLACIDPENNTASLWLDEDGSICGFRCVWIQNMRGRLMMDQRYTVMNGSWALTGEMEVLFERNIVNTAAATARGVGGGAQRHRRVGYVPPIVPRSVAGTAILGPNHMPSSSSEASGDKLVGRIDICTMQLAGRWSMVVKNDRPLQKDSKFWMASTKIRRGSMSGMIDLGSATAISKMVAPSSSAEAYFYSGHVHATCDPLADVTWYRQCVGEFHFYIIDCESFYLTHNIPESVGYMIDPLSLPLSPPPPAGMAMASKKKTSATSSRTPHVALSVVSPNNGDDSGTMPISISLSERRMHSSDTDLTDSGSFTTAGDSIYGPISPETAAATGGVVASGGAMIHILRSKYSELEVNDSLSIMVRFQADGRLSISVKDMSMYFGYITLDELAEVGIGQWTTEGLVYFEDVWLLDYKTRANFKGCTDGRKLVGRLLLDYEPKFTIVRLFKQPANNTVIPELKMRLLKSLEMGELTEAEVIAKEKRDAAEMSSEQRSESGSLDTPPPFILQMEAKSDERKCEALQKGDEEEEEKRQTADEMEMEEKEKEMSGGTPQSAGIKVEITSSSVELVATSGAAELGPSPITAVTALSGSSTDDEKSPVSENEELDLDMSTSSAPMPPHMRHPSTEENTSDYDFGQIHDMLLSAECDPYDLDDLDMDADEDVDDEMPYADDVDSSSEEEHKLQASAAMLSTKESKEILAVFSGTGKLAESENAQLEERYGADFFEDDSTQSDSSVSSSSSASLEDGDDDLEEDGAYLQLLIVANILEE